MSKIKFCHKTIRTRVEINPTETFRIQILIKARIKSMRLLLRKREVSSREGMRKSPTQWDLPQLSLMEHLDLNTLNKEKESLAPINTETHSLETHTLVLVDLEKNSTKRRIDPHKGTSKNIEESLLLLELPKPLTTRELLPTWVLQSKVFLQEPSWHKTEWSIFKPLNHMVFMSNTEKPESKESTSSIKKFKMNIQSHTNSLNIVLE